MKKELNRRTPTGAPTRPKQSAQEKAATSSFTASAYWKFESIPLQRGVCELSVTLNPLRSVLTCTGSHKTGFRREEARTRSAGEICLNQLWPWISGRFRRNLSFAVCTLRFFRERPL